MRPAAMLVERRGALVRSRGADGSWQNVHERLSGFDSMLSQLADPRGTPELLALREQIRSWRFYDHFRTDAAAPARMPQIGTHTPVLGHDGADLAAALQTIREIGDGQALDEAIDDAWIAALLSPRPPELLVLNEPETSLHPDLLPALGRLIAHASKNSQLFVVSHASRLIATLEALDCQPLTLEKELGETRVLGGSELGRPPWPWPSR